MAITGASNNDELIYRFKQNETKKTETKDSSYKNQLDKDAFLKLLTTQLRYQDPLSPMEDKEFITQMASFNSLEQMQDVNKNVQSMNSSLGEILNGMNGTFTEGLGAVNKNIVDGLTTIAKDVQDLVDKVDSLINKEEVDNEESNNEESEESTD
jgi:flagellar basal-body rod modification protein FlgD